MWRSLGWCWCWQMDQVYNNFVLRCVGTKKKPFSIDKSYLNFYRVVNWSDSISRNLFVFIDRFRCSRNTVKLTLIGNPLSKELFREIWSFKICFQHHKFFLHALDLLWVFFSFNLTNGSKAWAVVYRQRKKFDKKSLHNQLAAHTHTDPKAISTHTPVTNI